MNKKGFTLIELLAVIIILGVLMLIGTLSVSNYITNSRKEVYINNAKKIINNAKTTIVTDGQYSEYFFDSDTTVYINTKNIELETGQISPFAEMEDSYVAVIYEENDDNPFIYYWVSKDILGNRIDLTEEKDLTTDDIYNNKKRILNNKVPIGVRNKIVIIDENGTAIKASQVVEVTREEASECYSYVLSTNKDGKKEAKITYYNKECGTDVIIPGIIDGYTVTSIYSYTFHNRGLTSVVIPGSVTTIESSAFSSNKITKVTLPEGIVTIGDSAFSGNQIPSIYFPDSLKTIGARAFQTNKLTSFELPRGISSVGTCAFCKNPIKESMFLYAKQANGNPDYSIIRGYIGDFSEFKNNRFVLPPVVDGVALKTIAGSAFYAMSLTGWTVVIPDTVTTIKGSAFSSSGIGSVNLPDGLQVIEGSAFYSNRLTEINIPESVYSIGALAFNCNWVENPDQMWIYKRTRNGNKGEIDYTTLIGYAGKNRANLVIPPEQNGVALKVINDSALRYLSLTGGITIPSSVKTIGQLAFALNKLSWVDNGDGIKDGPFVYKRNSDGSINRSILLSYAAYQTKHVTIPSNVTEIYNYAFYYTYIEGVTIPEGVTKIGAYAFQLCRLKDSVVIPSTVTEIGNYAFHKYITWTSANGSLNKIVNKTGKSFNWKMITGGPSDATFVTGNVENWYGDIEVVDTE